MSRTQLQGLIEMANQIAANIKPGCPDDESAADKVANHLRKFWARSMKQQIAEYAQQDGSELSAVTRLAVQRL